MKYRIQVTVDGAILGQIIDLAFKNAKHDPDPKIIPFNEAPQPPPPLAPDVERELFPPTKTNKNSEAIFEAMLKTGPKRWSELRDGLVAEGFRKETINRLISRWDAYGKIRHTEEGLWAMADSAS